MKSKRKWVHFYFSECRERLKALVNGRRKAVIALGVIEKDTRKWHEIERALTQGICGERERRCIENCERDPPKIEHLLSPDTNNELQSILAIISRCQLLSCTGSSVKKSVKHTRSDMFLIS